MINKVTQYIYRGLLVVVLAAGMVLPFVQAVQAATVDLTVTGEGSQTDGIYTGGSTDWNNMTSDDGWTTTLKIDTDIARAHCFTVSPFSSGTITNVRWSVKSGNSEFERLYVRIGGDIIAVIAFLIMMFILMALAFPAGNTTAAMVLSLPMLGAAIWFGMDLLYIGMLALVAAFLFIKNFWLDKGN